MKDFSIKNKIADLPSALPSTIAEVSMEEQSGRRRRGIRGHDGPSEGTPRRDRLSSPTPKRVAGEGGGRSDKDRRPYRENVVGFILNRRNEVLIMKRAGTARHWQLPQGGVEVKETKREAVMREMKEETGLKGLRVMGVVENFHAYDWPKAPAYTGDVYRGQRQTLFFLRYTAKGLNVSLDPKEATGSRWIPINQLLRWLAPVRHTMARKVLRYYRELFKGKV